MIRSLFALTAFGLVAAAVVSCNAPVCGKGTKQVQLANGNVECQPADHVATTNEPCDVDGGTAEIIGGVCVSRIHCGDNTTFDPTTGVCTGTGGGSACPFNCGNLGPNDICVKGNIVDHEYTIGDGRTKVAEVSKKWFRVADTYGVEVGPGQDPVVILAVTAVLDTTAHPGR